ncbi:MAG: transposase [Candidatus Electronema sp. V4]|uniref:transposase n=1 Tax=Candidatus Electronema sp. V4 TaxID=3454756 RepID=UPI0040556116
MSKDHVRLLVSIPPQVTSSRFVRLLEGKTSHNLLSEYPHLRKTCRGRHFGAPSCFCRSSGNATDEAVNRSHRLKAGGVFTF